MTDKHLVIINPNSSAAVTDAIRSAAEPLIQFSNIRTSFETLDEGPPGIETQRHVDEVAAPLCRLIDRWQDQADGFVIACFSDPGLYAAREATSRPVIGISQAAILTALAIAERFGIIAILPASVSRHYRYVRQMGLIDRFAGDIPIGVGVTGLKDADRVLERMVAAGRRLIEEREADILIMGCAGMAGYRSALEERLQVPVIEPCQAAVGFALSALCFGWRDAAQMALAQT